MPKAPPKYNEDASSYTADEHYRSLNGERILSLEFIRYRNDLLAAGGLGDEATPEGDAPADLEAMSPDQHLADLQRP